MAYLALTQNDLAKWWITGTGSAVNRLSEVMDDCALGPAIQQLDAANAWQANGATSDEFIIAQATKPDSVYENLSGWRAMTNVADDTAVDALNADEWTWYTDGWTVVRLSDDSDPNATDMREYYAWDGAGAGPAFMTEHIADEHYQIHLPFAVGDSTTATTLTSIDGEIVYFDQGATFTIPANATLTLGVLLGSWGKTGAFWSIDFAVNGTTTIGNGGTFNFYNSFIFDRNNNGGIDNYYKFSSGTVNILEGVIQGRRTDVGRLFFDSGLASLSVDGFKISGFRFFTLDKTATKFNNFHSHGMNYGVLFNYNGTIFTGPLFTSSVGVDVIITDARTAYLRDAVSPPASISLGANSILIEDFTTNIHMADKDGADLASSLIDCEYAHLVEGSDNKTYKCIQDHTAVDATHKPITGTDWADFWELYKDTESFLKPSWKTGFDYKSGTTEFAQQTADANGDMTEQNIQYRKWTTATEYEETRLHKFTLSKAGYETLILENITVDAPIAWHLELKGPVRYKLGSDTFFEDDS